MNQTILPYETAVTPIFTQDHFSDQTANVFIVGEMKNSILKIIKRHGEPIQSNFLGFLLPINSTASITINEKRETFTLGTRSIKHDVTVSMAEAVALARSGGELVRERRRIADEHEAMFFEALSRYNNSNQEEES